MEESKIKKVGMIACVMGIVFIIFISGGLINLTSVVSNNSILNEVYNNAGVTEEMLQELNQGGIVNLNLVQVNMLTTGIQSATRLKDILFISEVLWTCSVFFSLGVFLVDIADDKLKKQLATLIFLENILALFPIGATFVSDLSFSMFAVHSLIIIAIVAVMVVVHDIVIVARHTEK